MAFGPHCEVQDEGEVSMDLNSAVNAHVEWKTKLRSAISTQSQFDASAVSKDNVCPLGQWLHGEAKLKYSKLAAYTECVGAHAAFHREAGKIAGLINQKNYVAAEAALDSSTAYGRASSAAVVAISKLKKEAAL